MIFGILSLFVGVVIRKSGLLRFLFYTDSSGSNDSHHIRLESFLALAAGAMPSGQAASHFNCSFSNPLVEPGFLGQFSGSRGFGAALDDRLLASTSSLAVQISAMVFGLFGVVFSYFLSTRFRFEGRCCAWSWRESPSRPSSPAAWGDQTRRRTDEDLQDITFLMMGTLERFGFLSFRSWP